MKSRMSGVINDPYEQFPDPKKVRYVFSSISIIDEMELQSEWLKEAACRIRKLFPEVQWLYFDKQYGKVRLDQRKPPHNAWSFADFTKEIMS